MPKGYWIVGVDISDQEKYKAYVAANAEPLRKYGAQFLVRGGRFEGVEEEPVPESDSEPGTDDMVVSGQPPGKHVAVRGGQVGTEVVAERRPALVVQLAEPLAPPHRCSVPSPPRHVLIATLRRPPTV